jgi:hypothetical protein
LERKTEMKLMQEELRRGRLVALVRCLTSIAEILPTILKPLSTTATLVNVEIRLWRVRAYIEDIVEIYLSGGW